VAELLPSKCEALSSNPILTNTTKANLQSMPVIPALRRMRQENVKFQASMGCSVSLAQKQLANQKKKKVHSDILCLPL
jgi:hypothetical protein